MYPQKLIMANSRLGFIDDFYFLLLASIFIIFLQWISIIYYMKTNENYCFLKKN